MKILLDTHTLIWSTLFPEKLSANSRSKIASTETTEILISSISIWEVCKLIQKNRFHLNEPVQQWMNRTKRDSRVSFIDVSTAIAIESCNLPGNFYLDPSDQIIVATARLNNAILLSKDQKILDYPHVNSEW
jgi:PIN domain nuclease of toxin-antitoxin system